MATEHTASLDELLGNLKRLPLQEDATQAESRLALEREIRMLLSVNANEALDELQGVVKTCDRIGDSSEQIPMKTVQATLRSVNPAGSSTFSPLPVDNSARLEARGKLGRDEPCWCGSGLKYRQCHYPD